MQHEVRLARAEMTKALVAMCTRLDDSGARSAQYTHELAGDVMSVFTPSRLWVFGSYARGATECGDLDALIELDYQAGPCPPTEVVENVLFGEVSRLSLSLGTPEQNKAGLDIADAVLIWSGKGSDWHTAIDSIKVDPDAGRFERDHDQLPLRAQQFAAAMDTRTFVSWGIRNGVFDSQFISLESLDTSAFEPEAGNEAVLETLALCPDHQTQALIPAIYKAIESLEPNAPVVLGGEADFTCGAILIGVGKPYLMPWHLESDAVTHLLLIPHITDREPNCIWILSRGPEFQGHQETYREITFF